VKIVHFTGNALSVVDAKGRVSLPSVYRSVVATRANKIGEENPFFVFVGEHPGQPCLQGYDPTHQDLLRDRVEAEVAKSGTDNFDIDLDERFAERFGIVEPISFDEAGRMVLPQRLRKAAGLDEAGSVALFFGASETFRIWNIDRYREAYADKPHMLRAIDGLKDPRK
jgi:MraZ protein